MNIGIVTYWFERGAAIVSQAYRNVLSAQHTVYIYARGGERQGKGDPKWDQEYVTWGKPVTDCLPTYIDWPDFERWVNERQLDAIIFNEQHSWDIILKCADLDATIGAYVDYYTAETIPFFSLYDFLLCNTQRHHGVFADHPQAAYIPWGVDCDLFQPAAPVQSDSLRFFHSAGMGGVELRKGTDILVRAFQHVTGPVKLIIHSQVGIEQYGDAAHLIKSDPRIEFIEATVGAPGLYHLGDVYVYPTKLEGIGLTIAEAQACGLPVITTDNGPMNEFVVNHVTGQLVEVVQYQPRADGYYWPQSICSETALIKAMQFYVDHPDEVARHKQQARTHALECLDWKKNTAPLSKMIEQFAKITPKPRSAVRAARAYERRGQAHLHMNTAFESYDRGDYSQTRHHLARGVRLDPNWLRYRGVWSIGFKTIFLRPLLKRAL